MLLFTLLICKFGPRSLPTKRAFHHFQTMVIAPIVSLLSLNRRKAKFYNSRLGIRQFRSKATEVGGERLQPHSQVITPAKHHGYPTFVGRRFSMGMIP